MSTGRRSATVSAATAAWSSSETPVLLADGRTRPLAELSVGDKILGTERRGAYRRCVTTEVQAHWSTRRTAYRVSLQDGTQLITSGDHRFLTRRGWKHVTGAARAPAQRPHLTVGSELLGTGRFAPPPVATPEYRRGYVCGMVRGDGHIASRDYERADGRRWTHHFSRLALVDREALGRTAAYLVELDVRSDELLFGEAVGARKAVHAIRTQARSGVERVRELTRWPLSPGDDWCKGFLAGVFDAEGSCGGQALRVANANRAVLDWTRACFAHFGFDVVEEPARPNGVASIRLRGGLRECLRFFHMTDPAITRKRVMEGMSLKSDARTRVVSVEPLAVTLPMYDITTASGDFIADGVVSHNCFARPTHTYLDFDAGRDFEREIVVKVNVPEVLRAELNRPSWKREHVAMGTNTDPYQWVEGRYRLMPGIWEALRDSATPCSVLTKSPLLLRDLALMRQVAQVTDMHANLSIPTLDEKAWRATEPHTPHPRARLEAVAELNRAGVSTGVLIAPLMPGINDAPEQIEPLLRRAIEAGATGMGGIALHLRGEVRGLFMEWLSVHRPELVERYEELYRRGAYAPAAERRRLSALVAHGPQWSARMRGGGASAGASVERTQSQRGTPVKRGLPVAPPTLF